MIDYGRIKGNVIPESKIIDDYSVWINTDVKEITLKNEEGRKTSQKIYEYHSIQYTKDEYIKMIDDKNESLEAQMLNTQLALVEIYESTL